MKDKNNAIRWGLTVFATVAAILLFYDTLFGRRVLLNITRQFLRALQPVIIGGLLAYLLAPADKIRAYTQAQFAHWTQEPFSAAFRRMLTLEQYHDPALGQLFQTYLASGPTKYMAEVFQGLTGDADLGAQLALEFYGPIYLLYALYDGAEDKPAVFATLNSHIDRFISRVETIRAANS